MVFLGLAVSSTFADVFVPDGLNPGDEYHLVFVTREAIDAINADINVYNDFAQNQAAMNPELTGTSMGVTYSAIVSTPTVDARDNALIEAPVYLVNGTMIATGFADMWDGSLNSPINYDQHMELRSDFAWTGSTSIGIGFDSFEVGSPSDLQMALIGTSTTQGSSWIEFTQLGQANHSLIYALSSKLTVPTVVPEPASLVVLTGLALAGTGIRRKR